jgi:hypothetical protein
MELSILFKWAKWNSAYSSSVELSILVKSAKCNLAYLSSVQNETQHTRQVRKMKISIKMNGTHLVSALCYNFLCGDIGFIYPAMSMVVIGPSLLRLRQSRWSQLYDVYWLVLMMVNSQRDRNTWTKFRIRIVLFSFEQQTRNQWNVK